MGGYEKPSGKSGSPEQGGKANLGSSGKGVDPRKIGQIALGGGKK